MPIRLLTFASLALILSVGNAVAACDFALRSTVVTDAQIKRAIEIVNAAVRDPQLELFFSNTTEHNSDSDGIPVHHIRPDQARPVVAEVPEGCRAIVISGVHFERSFTVLSKDNVLMQDKQISMLVFLLMHELGHIANKHYGAFLPATAEAVPNDDETEAKARERQADDYVCDNPETGIWPARKWQPADRQLRPLFRHHRGDYVPQQPLLRGLKRGDARLFRMPVPWRSPNILGSWAISPESRISLAAH